MAKAITFFNEKGGTGKTTLTALCANWLAYKKHEKVYVFDFDFPMYQLYNLRENDKAIIRDHPVSTLSVLSAANREHIYPIGKAAAQNSFSTKELESIAASIRKQMEKAGDAYFLFDFPGRYIPNDPVHYLSKKGLIDLVVFPIDSDRQSRASALRTYHEMQKVSETGGQKALFLWNRESQKERSGRKDWYSGADELFNRMGIDVAGARIRDIIIARRDASTFGFIRNTMCWPEFNIRKACGYIENIFEEVILRADGKWDDAQKERIYGKNDEETR